MKRSDKNHHFFTMNTTYRMTFELLCYFLLTIKEVSQESK